MSPVSPVFYYVETARMSLNSIGNKIPSPGNKMPILVIGALYLRTKNLGKWSNYMKKTNVFCSFSNVFLDFWPEITEKGENEQKKVKNS